MSFFKLFMKYYYIVIIFILLFSSIIVATFLVFLQVKDKTIYDYISYSLIILTFIMLLSSLLITMFTDPGRVPLSWGYYMEIKESKKRPFCIHCMTNKPERCHHCSQCNRCVLVMDHHCPWILNCIGFKNKKSFILILVYVILSCIIGS